MIKKLLAYKSIFTPPWLSLGLGSLGFSVGILILAIQAGGIEAIIPSVWLSVPLSVFVWFSIYYFLAGKFSQQLLSIFGFSFFAIWTFFSDGVREIASMVVLPENTGLNIIGLSGLLLLIVAVIEFLLEQSNISMIIAAFLIINVSLSWLIVIPFKLFHYAIRIFSGGYTAVVYISTISLMLYEFISFLGHEISSIKRRISR